jgi:photosystem II stability/assembly factor-like uncharacterized protein
VLISDPAKIWTSLTNMKPLRSSIHNAQHWVRIALMLCAPLSAAAQWAPLNGPHGAAVKSFANSPSTVLVGTYQGVYRSTDSGLHWDPTSSGLPLAHPLVTAATYYDNTFHVGLVDGTIYSSTDEGLTWTFTYSSGLGYSIDEILGHNGTLLVAESSGLARSSDGGETFEQVTGLRDSIYVMSLAASGNSLFAGTISNGMFRSDDEGVTWEPVVLPVPEYATSFVYCMAANGANMVSAPWGVICYSTDYGQNWQLGGAGIELAEPLCLHYDGPDVICGSRDGIYLSTDLGASFGAVILEDGTWTEAYLALDNIHLAGSLSKGIQRSMNAGATWAMANDDIHAWSVEHMTSDGQYLYAGSRRNGAHRYDPGTQSWTALCNDLAEYDHYVWEIGMIGPNLVFSGSSRVWYSNDHGNSWDQASGIDLGRHLLQEGDSSYFVGVDGWSGLFTTANNGEDWTAIDLGGYNVETALLADGYFYICRYGPLGVERSQDGNTWETVLPDSSLITAMVSDGATIYVGDSAGVVRATQDHGDTWTTLETVNDADPWVLSLSVCNGLLTMSTKAALYRYVPGTGWEPINQGLEGLQVMTQLCDGTGIVVGTDGGGVFRQEFFEAVPEQDGMIGFQCFPNPSKGLLSIRTTGVHGRSDLEVVNVMGQVVQRGTAVCANELITLSLDVPDGCYTLRLSAQGQFLQQRVQILR